MKKLFKTFIATAMVAVMTILLSNGMFVEAAESNNSRASEMELEYIYEIDDYGNNRVVGFKYENDVCSFEYDSRDIIAYICDEEGNRIAYYNCDDYGNILSVSSMSESGWVTNSSDSFIGNINKIRWLGYEYFEDSSTYLIDGRLYDSQTRKYTDGVDNSFAYSENNPFLSSEDEITTIDSYYSDLAAEEWSNSLLADSSYGTSISYTSGWYSSLSTVELLARCIYCEGGTTHTNEGNAVAWVILNRVHSSSFSDTPRGVITASGQFSSVIGGSSATASARTPSTSTSRWKNATYLACLMLTTTDTSEWRTLVGNTISGQLYFYSYTTAKNNGGSPFSGSSSSSLYYNSSRITDVYVLGYGSESSFTTLFADYSLTAYSRNIYYNYY